MTSEHPNSISSVSARTLVTRVATYALAFVTSTALARVLGADGRGRYYVPVALVTVAYYVINLGTEQAQLRMWSRREASPNQLLSSGLILGLGLGSLAAILLLVAYSRDLVPFLSPLGFRSVLIPLIALPFMTHGLLLTGFLLLGGGIQRVNRAMLTGAVFQLLGTIGLLVTDSVTVRNALLLFLAGVLIPWALMFRVATQLARLVRVRWADLLDQMRLGVRVAPHIIFGHLNLRVDVLILAHLAGAKAVGVYSIGVLFAELVWLPSDALLQAATRHQTNDRPEDAISVTIRAARMTLLLAVAIAIGIAIAAQLGIPYIYGSAFAEARSVVWILVPGAVMMALWRVVSNIIMRLDPVWVLPSASAAASVINVILNILLIHPFGIQGAALASTVSYSAGAVFIVARFLRKADVGPRALLPTQADARELARRLYPPRIVGDVRELFGE